MGAWHRTVLLFAVVSGCVAGQPLAVHLDGDELRMLPVSAERSAPSAPAARFIAGKSLEKLKNGNAVAFDFQLTVSNRSKNILRRAFERFVVSYDLWEERFSVTRMRSDRAAAAHLSAPAAEAWCMRNIGILWSGLPETEPLFLRLEIRAQENRGVASAEEEWAGLTLSGLIELFSRPGTIGGEDQWRFDAGPVLLRDLAKAHGKAGGV